MAIKKKADDLKTLLPEQVIETSQGNVTLKPFKFKDFNQALKYVSKYVGLFAEADNTLEIVQKIMGDNETLEDVAGLIGLASDCDPDDLGEMGWDEVANLLMTVIEQNIDFFNRLAGRLNKKAESGEPTKAKPPTAKVETDGEPLLAG